MIDAREPGSPGWWLNRLTTRLRKRAKECEALDRYYRNEAALPVLTTKAVREAYARLMRLCRTNFAELVVEAVRERMQVCGFRTGADNDELGDRAAWQMWQAANLDAGSILVHRAKLTMGDAYVLVGRDNATEEPIITPEDPRQVITDHDPANPRRVVAALKVFTDELEDADRAFLYLPGQVWRARRRSKSGSSIGGWSWESEDPDTLPYPVVPVVRFGNQVDIFGRSCGEFERHLSVLDRINYTILNRLEVATLQAFRQRAVKGELPTHDDQGNEIDYDDLFAADPGALWQLPVGVEIWESGQVDLGPIRQAIRDDVQDLAAVTRTPLFYLTPDAANGSAEGASLAREGLVFKVGDRIAETSEPWEQVMSLAFLFAGDEERANRRDMETLWESPERFSLAERFDAASKAQAAGVPWRTIMSSVLQFSPQEVERMQGDRALDSLLGPVEPIAAAGTATRTLSADEIRQRADVMVALIRAGASPESAARAVGLDGLQFTGAAGQRSERT